MENDQRLGAPPGLVTRYTEGAITLLWLEPVIVPDFLKEYAHSGRTFVLHWYEMCDSRK